MPRKNCQWLLLSIGIIILSQTIYFHTHVDTQHEQYFKDMEESEQNYIDASTSTTSTTSRMTSGIKNEISSNSYNSNSVVQRYVRTWRELDSTKWCAPRKTERVNHMLNIKGLLYVKIPKTGSTTLSGVTLRIGYRHSHLAGGCHVEACHGEAWQGRKNYLNRNIDESFLYTFVRNPSTRALSQAHHFHINLEHGKLNATNKEMFVALQKVANAQDNDEITNYQLFYLELKNPYYSKNEDYTTKISRIMEKYDFIGIAERFDESLVVMKFLLGLDASDILYIQSKNPKLTGGVAYDHGCRPITAYERTPEVDAYLESDEWIKTQEGDFALLDAANKSLDLTIENVIGRERFEAALSEHRMLLEKVNEMCRPVSPCENGILQVLSHRECYVHDSGCGFSCLDYLTREKYPPDGGFKDYVHRLRNTKYCYLGCASDSHCEWKTQVHGYNKKAWQNIVFHAGKN